jgi:hypothetical protein
MKKLKITIQILLCPLIVFCLMPINITAVTNENHKITPMIETYLDYTAGLTDEGKILIVGEDSENRQKAVDDLTEVIQIDIADSGLAALKSDGTVAVRFWHQMEGYEQFETENWNDIIQISFTDIYIVGLKSDGTVVSTKMPSDYDYGRSEVSDWKDIVYVSAGAITIGVKSNGTVVIAGKDTYEYAAEMSTWTDIVQIITSSFSPIVGIKSDGSVVAAWGIFNTNVECYEDISTWTDIVSVEVSRWHIIGIKKDGSVVMAGKYLDEDEPEICCYSTDCYEIEKWTDIISITTVEDEKIRYIGLKSDGTIILSSGGPTAACAGVEDWDLISEPQVGDLDGDKAVGITDLVTMAKFVHNRVPLTEETFATADLNDDNTVNAIDLSILKWLMIGR